MTPKAYQSNITEEFLDDVLKKIKGFKGLTFKESALKFMQLLKHTYPHIMYERYDLIHVKHGIPLNLDIGPNGIHFSSFQGGKKNEGLYIPFKLLAGWSLLPVDDDMVSVNSGYSGSTFELNGRPKSMHSLNQEDWKKTVSSLSSLSESFADAKKGKYSTTIKRNIRTDKSYLENNEKCSKYILHFLLMDNTFSSLDFMLLSPNPEDSSCVEYMNFYSSKNRVVLEKDMIMDNPEVHGSVFCLAVRDNIKPQNDELYFKAGDRIEIKKKIKNGEYLVYLVLI